MPWIRRGAKAAAACALSLLLFLPGAAHARYGYGEKEDPLLNGFPEAVAAAREGKWDDAAKALAKIEPVAAEIRRSGAPDPWPAVLEAAAGKDVAALGRRLAVITVGAIRLRLRSNLDEGFRAQGAARDRVRAAETYYERLLSGNVRKRSPRADAAVRAGFADAFRAVGSPGFLGAGGTPPDRDAYARAMKTVVGLLEEMIGK